MPRYPRFLLAQLLLTFPILTGMNGEVPVAPPIYTNAPGDQTSAIVASNGDQFLAVWLDWREQSQNLYAARFDRDGNLLEPTNIRIPALNSGNSFITAVLPIRNTWVVLWSGQTFQTDTPVPEAGLFVARIDSDGHVIDGPRVAITGAYPTTPHAAATNGSRILVAYNDKYSVLDENANVLRRDLPLPVGGMINFEDFVASNGSDFRIAWFDGASTESASVNANGDLTDPQSQALLAMEEPIAISSDGDDYLLITRGYPVRQFLAHRFNAISQSSSTPAVLPSFGGIITSGDLIWNGTSYLFAATTTIETASSAYEQILAVRLDRSGTVIDATAFPFSRPMTGNGNGHTSIAWNGAVFGSVWSTTSNPWTGDDDVFATLIDGSSLRTSEPILLSRSANLQVNPSVAFSGRNFLAVWEERTGTYIGRIGLNGESLDGRGIRITPAGYNPKVIFDGSNYLVGWLTAGANLAILWISRVSPDGQVLDGDGVEIASSTCVFNFDMTSSGDRTLVAWDECGYHALRVMQIDRNAQPVGASVVITPESMRTANPSIAWNGNEFLVAFQEQIVIPGTCLGPNPVCESFRSNIRGVRVSPALTVLDTDPLAIAVSDSEDQRTPLIASDGKDFLVGWNAAEMRTRSIAADGTLGATTALDAGALSSLIWDGMRYALAFTAAGDTFLTHAGKGDRLAISATADVESEPRLVATGNGIVTATYVRVATEPLYGGVARAFLRQPVPTRARAVRAR